MGYLVVNLQTGANILPIQTNRDEKTNCIDLEFLIKNYDLSFVTYVSENLMFTIHTCRFHNIYIYSYMYI